MEVTRRGEDQSKQIHTKTYQHILTRQISISKPSF